MLGEGYYYISTVNRVMPSGSHSTLWGYDNFARYFFGIIVPTIKDNIPIYQSLIIIIAIIFSIVFYTVLVRITKSKLLSVSATIFFSANYLALFEYFANGNYQRFLQRFPNIIPLVISFYFLWKFFKIKKTRLLIFSMALYVLAVVMGHFSSIALPLFLIYPILELLEEKKKIKHLPFRIFICILFVFFTLFLTSESVQKPSTSFLTFLKTEKNIPQRVLYQIPHITIPLDTIMFIAEHAPEPIKYPYTSLLGFLLIPCLIFYLGGGILVYKRLPKLFVLYSTFFLSMVAVMLTYMYVDTRLNVLIYFGEDRYYIFSSLFAVVLWSIVVKALFYKNNKKYLFVSIILLSAFVFHNTQKIWTHIDEIQYKSEMNKKFISYFRNNRNSFENNSFIIAPSYLAWPAPIITEAILENKNVEFILASTDWQKNLWSKKSKVFVFDYDYQKEKLINLTNDYRNGKKIIFKN